MVQNEKYVEAGAQVPEQHTKRMQPADARGANPVFVKKSKKIPRIFADSRKFQNFFCEIAKKHLHFFVKYAKIRLSEKLP